MPLIDEIRAAAKRLLERLRVEVLRPLLTDARMEREKGLASNDPLAQAYVLTRRDS